MEVFNKGILERCIKLYSDRMSSLNLPMSEEDLQRAHEASRGAAMQVFDEQHFGHHHAKRSIEQLDDDINKVESFSCKISLLVMKWRICRS